MIEIVTLIGILICNGIIAIYAEAINRKQDKVITILQGLQEEVNLEVPKEVNASLVDVGKRSDKEEVIDIISRTDSIWEEDSLEGGQIEEMFK